MDDELIDRRHQTWLQQTQATAPVQGQEEEERVTRSSGNVFADLGFENPEEELAKAKLVRVLSRLISDRELTQTRIAGLLEIDQPAVSRLLRGRTSGFTIDRLTRLLNLLGYDVDLHVVPKRSERARIEVLVFSAL